ncbi:hypothetical protein [Candidatus Nitrospira bockiana]
MKAPSSVWQSSFGHGWHVGDHAAVLRRHWWLILAVALSAVFLIGVRLTGGIG